MPDQPNDHSPLETFREYFSAWAIELPPLAVEDKRNGQLLARGWVIRWRWHADGGLEFRAAHRMTNERWHLILPDGTLTSNPVPCEVFAVDVPGAQEAYHEKWREHGRALDAAGMSVALEDAPAIDYGTEIAWLLDGDGWQVAKLPPRPS